MYFKTRLFAAVLAALLLPVAPAAACDFQNPHAIKSLTAGFEAWKVVTGAMSECGNFEAELDQEFRQKQPAAFAANPSQYAIGGVANATLVPLLNDGSIRALDDLVAKHGAHLPESQLIRHNGRVMAVAMMVNARHFMYRQDIFADLGLSAPETYDDVLAAAEKIKADGQVEYPLGMVFNTGSGVGLGFVNMYLGFGGEIFNADKTPSVNNAKGVQTLEMMKALTEYMDPEYLVSDSTYVQKQMQQGKIAMATLWASRAGAMNNPEESQVVNKVAFSAAPAVVAGGPSATTLWWDGMVVAQNISEPEAESAFRLIVHGISPESLERGKDAAIWLTFPDSPISKGVIDSQRDRAPAYPASTEMGLMFTVLGNNIADFLTGKESARQTLTDIEDAYVTAAKEAGVL